MIERTALRSSERRALGDDAAELLGALPDGVVMVDGSGAIGFVNRRLAELSVVTELDLVGRPVHELLLDASLAPMTPARIGSEQAGPRTSEWTAARLRRGDGTTIAVEVHARTAELGGDLWTMLTVRDVAERLATEEALRESEERFRKVFEEGPFGIVLIGRDLRVADVNHAVCALSGYSREELIGMPFPAIGDRRALDEDALLIRRVLAGEIETYRVEKPYLTKHGDVRHAVITTAVLRDADGAPLYGLRIVDDITEEKRLERELAAHAATARGILAELTPRESEIVALLADGLTAPQMASRLVVSTRTVESHLASAYRKLGVRSKAAAVAEFHRLHAAVLADEPSEQAEPSAPL